MNVYLAARFSEHDKMRGVRDVLRGMGHTVTSRWIDLHGGDQLESATQEKLNTDPESCSIFGIHDLEDMDAADTIISFTETSGGKGGRHVEFGYGLGRGKHMILVGPREHIFHTLPQVQHFPKWSRLVMALTQDWMVTL